MGAVPGSDEALLARWAGSTPDERRRLAGELFQRHYDRVARWCYRLTGDRDRAADLTQEVFAKAYRHLDSFRGDAQFTTWLYAIVRREASTFAVRPATRALPADDEAGIDALASPAEPHDAALDRESDRQQVHRLLGDTLDDVERTVFALHYGDDMTLDQITRVLGLANASGAKAYIVSARRKLARAVQRLRARGHA